LADLVCLSPAATTYQRMRLFTTIAVRIRACVAIVEFVFASHAILVHQVVAWKTCLAAILRTGCAGVSVQSPARVASCDTRIVIVSVPASGAHHVQGATSITIFERPCAAHVYWAGNASIAHVEHLFAVDAFLLVIISVFYRSVVCLRYYIGVICLARALAFHFLFIPGEAFGLVTLTLVCGWVEQEAHGRAFLACVHVIAFLAAILSCLALVAGAIISQEISWETGQALVVATGIASICGGTGDTLSRWLTILSGVLSQSSIGCTFCANPIVFTSKTISSLEFALNARS
jgi:hypothetical protein